MRVSHPLLTVLLPGALVAALVLTSPVAAQFGGAPAAAPRLRPVTGDAVTDAVRTLNFRSVGPANMGGRVTAILGVPGDPKTFWVGGADGGVWKTTDAGTTFQGVFEDYFAYSVGPSRSRRPTTTSSGSGPEKGIHAIP